MKKLFFLIFLSLFCNTLLSVDIHVSVKGNDNNEGSSVKPFRTISQAANVAMPGDIVTVHTGVYREQITPPRGGNSDNERIVYQAEIGRAHV